MEHSAWGERTGWPERRQIRRMGPTSPFGVSGRDYSEGFLVSSQGIAMFLPKPNICLEI